MKKLLFIIPVAFALVAWQQTDFFSRLVAQAIAQTKQKVEYDPAYVQIKYPGGDVPSNTGVCTDLVIRAYRGLGIDLQKEVHEDMAKNFEKYPKFWKLKKTDTNIDHRRVPNLMVFFERKNAKLKISSDAADYKPGDIVTWNLGDKHSMSGVTHIGIVTNIRSADKNRYLVAHNIGRGNELEDMLFSFTIIGHYRYEK